MPGASHLRERGEASALLNLGAIHAALGRNDEGIAHLDLSLAILVRLGDRAGQVKVLNNPGNVHRTRGDYRAATEHLTRARRLSDETADPIAAAISRNGLGKVCQLTGRISEALERYRHGEEETLADLSLISEHGGCSAADFHRLAGTRSRCSPCSPGSAGSCCRSRPRRTPS